MLSFFGVKLLATALNSRSRWHSSLPAPPLCWLWMLPPRCPHQLPICFSPTGCLPWHGRYSQGDFEQCRLSRTGHGSSAAGGTRGLDWAPRALPQLCPSALGSVDGRAANQWLRAMGRGLCTGGLASPNQGLLPGVGKWKNDRSCAGNGAGRGELIHLGSLAPPHPPRAWQMSLKSM